MPNSNRPGEAATEEEEDAAAAVDMEAEKLGQGAEGAEGGKGDGKRKKTPAQMLTEKLELPAMLLNATDAGKPLQPLLFGASASHHAGQWAMALQATVVPRTAHCVLPTTPVLHRPLPDDLICSLMI